MNRGIELKSENYNLIYLQFDPKVNNCFDHGRDYAGEDTYSGDSHPEAVTIQGKPMCQVCRHLNKLTIRHSFHVDTSVVLIVPSL